MLTYRQMWWIEIMPNIERERGGIVTLVAHLVYF